MLFMQAEKRMHFQRQLGQTKAVFDLVKEFFFIQP
jgi:hypothetical protein